MRPVVTLEQMRALDAEAIVSGGIQPLIERAGYGAAMVAREMLGGLYGRKILVIAGKGHNGDDGRAAARVLKKRGAKVDTVGVGDAPELIEDVDLVIDAAFGTGFHGEYRAPLVAPMTRVLALDLPSGLDGTTGIAKKGAVQADVTVTFGAYKPGLLFNDGPAHTGRLVLDPIGFVISSPAFSLIEDSDCVAAIDPRPATANKWADAVFVLAGSPGMTGAARLCVLGAMRAGASMVRLGAPGVAAPDFGVTEAVAISLPSSHVLDDVLGELRRCHALVVGPGLSLNEGVLAEVRTLVESVTDLPIVIDADGLSAFGTITADSPPIFSGNARVILTPHDGEFARLFGSAPGADRIASACELARRCGATVLLKGPTTIVASSEGEVLLSNSGTSSLATAGTGDVLSGVIGALLARGLSTLWAGAIGAYLHGRASQLAPREGLLASDLPELIADTLSELEMSIPLSGSAARRGKHARG